MVISLALNRLVALAADGADLGGADRPYGEVPRARAHTHRVRAPKQLFLFLLAVALPTGCALHCPFSVCSDRVFWLLAPARHRLSQHVATTACSSQHVHHSHHSVWPPQHVHHSMFITVITACGHQRVLSAARSGAWPQSASLPRMLSSASLPTSPARLRPTRQAQRPCQAAVEQPRQRRR